jgi:hypothetical protein
MMVVRSSFGQSALQFDGTDCSVDIADSAGINMAGSFTLEAWIRPDRLIGSQQIIYKWASYGDQRSYLLALYNDQLKVAISTNGDTNGVYVASSTTRLMTNQCVHVAGTFDGSELALFIDGKKDATTTPVFGAAYAGTGTVRVGGTYTGIFQPFAGAIDEVRVSDTVRYTANFDVPVTEFTADANTAILLHMNEGSGTTTRNNGLLGGDGTLVGGVSWVGSVCEGDGAPCAGNSSPSIITIGGPSDVIPLNTTVQIGVTFEDIDADQGHVVLISWDDGSPDSLATVTAGESSTSIQHLYAAPGVYSVGVTVQDSCGAQVASSFEYIVVYDPNGGFVTGGGWIASPAGAYIPDGTLTGKATFGFVSKYQRGAKQPNGQTEFQFQAASLNFKATVYEWLVISGAKAQYKGSGTINGTGDYVFMVTLTDGQLTGGGGIDKFRIKIWEASSGNVVYDNQLGRSDKLKDADPQALSGGSIVIHKK